MKKRFVKKPIPVEAVQWTGTNLEELKEFAGELFRAQNPYDMTGVAGVYDKLHGSWISVLPGQWVIRGVQGEFYPIDPGVLAATYEMLEDSE